MFSGPEVARAIQARRLPAPLAALEQLIALIFCTTALAIRRSLWLLTFVTYQPLARVAPRLKCRLRASVLAAMIGAAALLLSQHWATQLTGARKAGLLALCSLFGTATVFAVQWPVTLAEVQR